MDSLYYSVFGGSWNWSWYPYMISILPPAEIRMYALLGICSKFESRFFLAQVILGFTHIFWLDNISVEESWGRWNGKYPVIHIDWIWLGWNISANNDIDIPINIYCCHFYKKSSSSVTSFCLFSYLSYPWWRKINLCRLASSKGSGGAFNLYCPNSKM